MHKTWQTVHISYDQRSGIAKIYQSTICWVWFHLRFALDAWVSQTCQYWCARILVKSVYSNQQHIYVIPPRKVHVMKLDWIMPISIFLSMSHIGNSIIVLNNDDVFFHLSQFFRILTKCSKCFKCRNWATDKQETLCYWHMSLNQLIKGCGGFLFPLHTAELECHFTLN